MEQVTELLALIDRRRADGVIVATNFTFRRYQPNKERAHPRYEFWGDTDGTRELPEPINLDEVMRRIGVFFNLVGHHKIDDQHRAFSVGALPPWVRVFFLVLLDPLSVAITIYSFIFLMVHGQDRSVYFSVMPLADWPRGVDA